MKVFIRLRILALAVAGLAVGCPRAGAQGFGLSVIPSATSMLVSNSLTYTINVTNLNRALTTAYVTNQLPSSVQFQSATPSGSFTNNGSVVIFDLGAYFGGPGFLSGQSVVLTLTAQPTAAGLLTNIVTVSSFDVTNTATTNVVVLVTNAPTQTADLGVAMTGPAQPVITNDWMTFGVTVTNAGPNAAPNVMLTTTLPPGVGYIGASPASPAPSIAGSNIIFNLGTMAGRAFTSVLLTVQPTNAGGLLFSSLVGSSGVTDPNPTNNSAGININVTNYLPIQLIAITNSAQAINKQNGLEEQMILLTNTGATDVPAARVVVTGLNKQLFNAVGTNNGAPFVDYSTGLAAGQGATLLLQYAPRGSFPFTNGQLHAFALPSVPDWTPPAATLTGADLKINRFVRLTNGNMLVEWQAVPNRTYTVVYSDNFSFSNALIAPPSITAPANEVQWIDYGPPTTVSAPGNVGARYYRVFQNP